MRRLLAVLLAATVILVPSAAQASTGWARYDSNTWVRWTSSAELPKLADNLTPAAVRAVERYNRARARAIKGARAAHAAYVRAHTPPAPAPAPPAHVSGSVPELVARLFAARGQDVGRALCTADRESHFEPWVRNPYTGAGGVFQIMPANWPRWSSAAGYGGASVFSALANVGTAAWAVEHYGWGPWNGGC